MIDKSMRENKKEQMIDGMLISVLVPLYNVEPFICRCVNSLFGQTYPHLEFIFVNDASTDNTLAVLQRLTEKFPERAKSVKIVNNPNNRGISTARDLALSLASGEYVLFVDGDDFLETDAIARLHKKKQSTGADIVVGDFVIEYKNCKVVYKHQNTLSNEKYFSGVIRRSIPCCIWGKLIRRDLFFQNQIKGIDNVSFGEDFAITTRLIYKAQKIDFLNHPIYHYIKTNQQSITKNLSMRCINDLLIVNGVLFEFFENNREIKNQLKLYTKLLLLKSLPTVELLRVASEIYPESIILRSLGIKDRIVLALANSSHYRSLLYLNRLYFNLKKFLHCISNW